MKMTKSDRHNRVVALSGGFDPPTPGQVAMIQDASEVGRLTILLNSDEWCGRVRSFNKPFLSYEKRKELLETLPFVDRVLPAHDDDGTVVKNLRELKPDFFGNGGERTPANTPEVDVCRELGIGMLWFLGDKIQPDADQLLRRASMIIRERRELVDNE